MMEYWTLYEKPKITGEDEEDDMLKGISPDPMVDETDFLWPAFSSVDIGAKLTTPSIPTVEDMLIAEREAKSLKLDNLVEQTSGRPDSSTSHSPTESSDQPQALSADEAAGSAAETPVQENTVTNKADTDESQYVNTKEETKHVDTDSVNNKPVEPSAVPIESENESMSSSTAASDSTQPSHIPDAKSPEFKSSEERPIGQQQLTVDHTIPSPTEDASPAPVASDFSMHSTTVTGQTKAPFGYGQGANMESIYKTIMTRILNLEQNATLSQRYLDDQNRMLNEVFETMEDRHREQLLQLVGQLNSTASLRIDTMKRRYERLYRMTARELETTRNETAKELQELTAKLHIMADQVVFEKRLSLIQLILLISLFLFTAANKGTLSTLSPIVAAQAEERQRRQSISHHQSSASQTELTEERPRLSRQPSSQALNISKSTDTAPAIEASEISELSEAKRELQITKSHVEKLKLKPTRQSTAELLSKTAEFDPLRHERWDVDDGMIRLHEAGQQKTSRKTETLPAHLNTPILTDSPTMLSEAWSSPSPSQGTPSAIDHLQLEGDLRLSRASSFVDHLDLAYADSPKMHNLRKERWKEIPTTDDETQHDDLVVGPIEHIDDPPCSLDDHQASFRLPSNPLSVHSILQDKEDDEATVPNVDDDERP
jgi:hypothetical protein